MTNLLNENPRVLSPELFSRFMSADKKATERMLNIMIPAKRIDILSFSDGIVEEDFLDDDQPFVKVDALVDFIERRNIYITYLTKENGEKGRIILDWLVDHARQNSQQGAVPAIILLDESDNIVYENEDKPVEVSTLCDENRNPKFIWTKVNLLSDRYPGKAADIIHDLRASDESDFKTTFLKNIYHKAYIEADIDRLRTEARSRWLADLQKEIEALGVNPEDFIKE